MTPEPTQRDLAVWNRLLDRAAACAAAPRAPAGDLATAIEATKRACVPQPPPTRLHPFVRLHRLCARFTAETLAGRAFLAADLAAVVAECRASLERSAQPRRFRADIDG